MLDLDDYREFKTDQGPVVTPDERMYFTYDALDRWLSANQTTTEGYTQSYGYNAIGNIISTTMLGAYIYNATATSCASGTPASKPHAVSQAGNNNYVYDCNGNMTRRVEVTATQRITYTQGWDVENRLKTVTNTVTNQVTQFVYDGDGNRVLQLLPDGSRTAYAGALEVSITATQRITKTYYSAGAQLIAMRVITTGGNALYFLHSDHLGSTSLTTNASGGVVARQLYDAWGNVRLRGDVKTDIGYTAQREDRSTNLMFYRARYYSPYLNRWLSPDTIVPQPGNPQDLNRYSYTRNNPLKYTDPTGHCAVAEDEDTCRMTNPLAQYRNQFGRPYASGLNPAVSQGFNTPGHQPPGVDWVGTLNVYAPYGGTVREAGPDDQLGIWQFGRLATPEEIAAGNVQTLAARGGGVAIVAETTGLIIKTDSNAEVQNGIIAGFQQRDNWVELCPGCSHERGTRIRIDHGNGIETTYYHVRIDANIQAGMTVNKGQLLGVSASIGRSTGAHLHYTVRINGRAIDPLLNQPQVIVGPRPRTGRLVED